VLAVPGDYRAAMNTVPDDSLNWPSTERALRAAAEDRRDTDVEVAELVPAEWAGISLVDRLLATCGRNITLTVSDGVTLGGVLAEVGTTWILMRTPASDTVVALSEVVAFTGMGPPTAANGATHLPEAGVIWREWARQRRRARWALRDGRVTSGSVWRVGSDALDLVQHPIDRAGCAADQRVVLPFTAIRWATSPS
jgi:hypothetical protein